MKNNLRTIVIATLAAFTLLVAAPAAHAQRGQGMRGMRGMSALANLRRQDVRKDLKLTDKQKTDLDALQEKMQSDMREMFQNGGGGDREAMQKAIADKMAEAQKTVDTILTADQQARLKQINIQMQGNAAVTDPDIQAKLKMTDDQKSKIKDLQAKQQEANQGLFAKMQSGELDRDGLRAAMTKNTETMSTELGKILTDDQKKALADMSGPKFDKDPNENPGFGGGGR